MLRLRVEPDQRAVVHALQERFDVSLDLYSRSATRSQVQRVDDFRQAALASAELQNRHSTRIQRHSAIGVHEHVMPAMPVEAQLGFGG
jgi:hypothetical protein